MSCPVTLEAYTTTNFPVALPCGHTVSVVAARAVLTRAPRDLGSEQCQFTCPVCRAQHWVPVDHQFPKNYAVLELLDTPVTVPPTPPAQVTDTPSLPSPPDTSAYRVTPHSDGLVKVTATRETLEDAQPPELFVACDISGSMGATVNQSLGLTRLDLVKYNVEMLLRRLATWDGDEPARITILAFHSTVEPLATREPVTPQTLTSLIQRVQELRPRYTTNILAVMRGLCEAMIPGRHNVAIVLTDGQPTDHEGHVTPDNPTEYLQILQQYRDRYSSFSTLGYGYRLSHRIMLETARAGGGVASFGSDESMISNVFIRWVGWALTTVSPPAPCLRGESDGLAEFRVPALRYGGTQQYVLVPPTTTLQGSLVDPADEVTSPETLAREKSRLEFCRTLEQCILLRDPAALHQLGDSLDPVLRQECLPGGQIGMAFLPQYFKTWGQAYLYATLRGHEIAHQWNFKDTSLGRYRTEEFQREVEQLDRIFQMMPDPTPSKKAHESIHSHGGMSQVFNNANSSCWAEGSVITLANGEECPIEQLRAGDRVQTFDPRSQQYRTAGVRYVVRQPCQNHTTLAVPLGGTGRARMTPNHPVLTGVGAGTEDLSPAYRFPQEVGQSLSVSSQYVYNLMLTQHHHVVSDGVVCVTLGHGMTEGMVRELGYGGDHVVPHSFFGDTVWMEQQCQELGTDPEGYVTVDPARVVRNPVTGWVTSWCG